MNTVYSNLRNKIEMKQAKIAVVGLGYVGLPLAVEYAKKGFSVLGLEVDKDRVARIKKKVSYISDVPGPDLKKVIAAGRFFASHDFSLLKQADVAIICVPTPLKRKYHPDISYIMSAVRQIKKYLHPGQLVVLESTTYPGTTEEAIMPRLEGSGLKCGRDFYLAFSPERIDPGNARYPVHKIPKVVGGLTAEATKLASLLYGNIVKKAVPVSSARVAETVKLLENTFRIVNIGLIDEMAMMCHKMKINIWEVIEAARTKPFGFMPFYPGPGVGGHCLDKNETIFIKEGGALKALQMPEFIDYIRENKNKNIEALSFDPLKKSSVFKKVTAASVRPYNGQMVNIATEDGRLLKVTDLHPMFIYNDSSWQLRYAKNLQKGDCLPICLDLPPFKGTEDCKAGSEYIDLIGELKKRNSSFSSKIRVKPLDFFWKDYAEKLKPIIREGNSGKIPDCYWDYLSDNYLPLKYFYRLEESSSVDHHRLKLATGRGPSYSEIAAAIELNEPFCRLIGYYLSEGCFTRDKSSRIRFSFNRLEKEYIDDVLNILAAMGIRASVYESKQWQSSCIKVSSDIFGFLIHEVLGCGKNCYEMQIPEIFFSFSREKKRSLAAGLFRGDGSVEHFFGKWRYRRNEKEYLHNVNTASVSYFTSSKRLFQQIVVLLHDLGIIPTFRKRKYSLSIFGYKQLELFKDLFAGRKKDIIEKYLFLNKNRPVNKTFKRFEKFATVKVKSVSLTRGDWVYSIETEKPHAFVTSYGIVVHNCIPKDPLYLFWKAKKFGFHSRFIKLSSDVITKMPEYVVRRVEEILSKAGIELPAAKILVIGATYKKDIKDLRKSPALDIIEFLQRSSAAVAYFDPLIPYLRINHAINLKSIKLNKSILEGFDCVIIATDHSCVDYGFLRKHAKVIFDARNVYRGITDKKIVRL